ncbi:hypothetical protein EYZ66_13710 [Aequoribacter fuscus]|nr:hypothetical protein EYZ66_13710 [Aequoribacter fuscus]
MNERIINRHAYCYSLYCLPYSMFWICSLSSGLDLNKLNELSKRNRSKMPVCPPNCPPLAYGFY